MQLSLGATQDSSTPPFGSSEGAGRNWKGRQTTDHSDQAKRREATRCFRHGAVTFAEL